MSELEAISWTTDFLDWVPWIETVDEVGVSADQRARIDATLGSRAGSTYYETLASDLESVRTRTLLFSDIFESEGGVPRADRELAATATSRINGCVYCASVHARLYGNLSKERTLVRGLLDEGVTTSLPPHQRAIVDLSSKLTTDPESLTAADLDRVRAIGISDLGILDLIQSAAIFANANRLMLTLGEPARKRQ
ncbi:MAG TPA: peroxidase-related enzyme [Thermomicrobiales bacterium]|nr:peroxidase-related enzyme [Thermomicrobiales bacterium]